VTGATEARLSASASTSDSPGAETQLGCGQVVEGSALVANRLGGDHQARQRQGGRQTAGGRQTDNDLGSGRDQLLGDQHRERPADGAWHHATPQSVPAHGHHRRVKASPRLYRTGRAVVHDAVEEVPVEIEHADRRDRHRLEAAGSPCEIVSGTLVLLGLGTRLACVPLLTVMAVALATTKWPMLVNRGSWTAAHEARTDWSMTLGALFLFIVGAGPWSLDARLSRRRTSSR
jgi:hypothetical protein